jgi:hypothetical protein
MRRAAIPYRGGELEVEEEQEQWRVRLGELEASSRYLDWAIAQLLDDEPSQVHHLATRLVEALLDEHDVREQQVAEPRAADLSRRTSLVARAARD